MRIRSVRIRNFRGFADETFSFDPASGRASVQRFGKRLIFKKFAPFFEDEKNKATVGSLRERFKAVINGVVIFWWPVPSRRRKRWSPPYGRTRCVLPHTRPEPKI